MNLDEGGVVIVSLCVNCQLNAAQTGCEGVTGCGEGDPSLYPLGGGDPSLQPFSHPGPWLCCRWRAHQIALWARVMRYSCRNGPHIKTLPRNKCIWAEVIDLCLRSRIGLRGMLQWLRGGYRSPPPQSRQLRGAGLENPQHLSPGWGEGVGVEGGPAQNERHLDQ